MHGQDSITITAEHVGNCLLAGRLPAHYCGPVLSYTASSASSAADLSRRTNQVVCAQLRRVMLSATMLQGTQLLTATIKGRTRL